MGELFMQKVIRQSFLVVLSLVLSIACFPTVYAEGNEETIDGNTLRTEMTYDETYASSQPEGTQYVGTLEDIGANVYSKQYTYEDLGYSSAEEMDEAFSEARKEAEAASDEEHDRYMTWLNNQLSEEELEPIREEAKNVSDAADLLLLQTEQTVVTTEENAEENTDNTVSPEDIAQAEATVKNAGLDLNGPSEEDLSLVSISSLADGDVSTYSAQGGSSSASVTVVDDDAVVVYVCDENNAPLRNVVVQFQEKGASKLSAVTGDQGVAVFSGMGKTSGKSDLHRGYICVSKAGYKTIEHFDDDFNAGSRLTFKMNAIEEDVDKPYISGAAIDGVNILETSYTMYLSGNQKAQQTQYPITLSFQNCGQTSYNYALVIQADGVDDENVKQAFSDEEMEALRNTVNLRAIMADQGSGVDGVVTFTNHWTYFDYDKDLMLLSPGCAVYLYRQNADFSWEKVDDVNLKVEMATNDAAWKELSLSLTGYGWEDFTLPGNLGKVRLDLFNFNLYATIDLSGKYMLGYGRDWFRDQDKEEFESSAYEPSGSRWSQMADRMEENIRDQIEKRNKKIDKLNANKSTIAGNWSAFFDLYGCIMAQWDSSTGYFSGDIVMTAEFEARGSVTFMYLIPVVSIPAYIGLEGIGAGSFTGDLGIKFKGSNFSTFLRTVSVSNDTGATIEITLSALAYAGVGIRGITSIEANVQADFNMLFGLGTANQLGQHIPYHSTGTFNWYASIRAQLFFLRYTHKILGPKDDYELWDTWLPEQTTPTLLSMDSVQEDTEKYDVYQTDMDAVSEGSIQTGESTLEEDAAQQSQEVGEDQKIEESILGSSTMQLLASQGGNNKGTEYLFRIASVTDEATGISTPRLMIQNEGKCSSGVQETYVLPSAKKGEDAGKVPYDYTFAVSPDVDGKTGNFTIAVTTGYLDATHSLAERARDLRIRVYRFDSNAGSFTEMKTLMPIDDDTSGYCGTPTVYAKGDKFIVATPAIKDVNNTEMLQDQIADAVYVYSYMPTLFDDSNVYESYTDEVPSFTKLMIHPGDDTYVYMLDSNEQQLYQMKVTRNYFSFSKNIAASPVGTTTSGRLTNLGYLNGYPGEKNYIMYTNGDSLYAAASGRNFCYQFDNSVDEYGIQSSDNSLLYFSDASSASYPKSGDAYHILTISKQEKENVYYSNIAAYEFSIKNVNLDEKKRIYTLTSEDFVYNHLKTIQDRNITNFTAAYHANTKNKELKDLHLNYMADEKINITKKATDTSVGTIEETSNLYNLEIKGGKDASVIQLTPESKTVDKKKNTFRVNFDLKNSGTEDISDITVKLHNDTDNQDMTFVRAINGEISTDKTEATLDVNHVFWNYISPGETKSCSAVVNIPESWSNKQGRMTMSVTKIDGVPLSEIPGQEVESPIAVMALNDAEENDEHSLTAVIEEPTLHMNVEEIEYLDDDDCSHYAEVTFENNNIQNVNDVEIQIYTNDANDRQNIASEPLETYALGTLSAENEQGNTNYTVYVPLPEDASDSDYKHSLNLYFVLCQKDARPFVNSEDKAKVYDIDNVSNMTLTKSSKVVTSSDSTFKGIVTSDADGAYAEGTSITISAEANPGYVFDGWYDLNKEDEQCVSKDAVWTFTTEENMLYNYEARFVADPNNLVHRVFFVSADENGEAPLLGSVSVEGGERRLDDNGRYAYAIKDGETVQLHAEAYDPETYRFKGWYSEGANNMRTLLSEDPDFAYTATTTDWVDAVFEPYPESSVRVYLNPMEGYGTTLGWKRTEPDGKLKELPEAQRDGYTFVGWFTEIDGGEQVTADTVLTSQTTLYAHYTKEDPSSPEITPQPSASAKADVDPSSKKQNKNTSVDTSDHSHVPVYLILLLGGIVGGVTAFLKRRHM